MRPVRQLGDSGLVAGSLELIGTLEQAYMDIRCPDGGTCGSAGLAATHEETGPTAFLSAVASLTPWSDFNQSPRNMYQCQMAKQTMGTPMDSYPFRTDTKLYRLHTPQKPVARTQGYEKYQVNEYPLGTNAVVAVLSYTGCAAARDSMSGTRASHASAAAMTWRTP
jgi:DNA-directed RNA polymerase I subunit RPA2